MHDLTRARNYVRRALEELDAHYPSGWPKFPENEAAETAKEHLETALHWMSGRPQRIEEPE